MKQASNVLFRLARTAPIFFIVAFGAATNSSAATVRFDNGGGDGLWETPANWNETDPVTPIGPDTLPGTADQAEISNSFTVNLSSAQSVAETVIAHPNGAASTANGVATLNVLTGSSLAVTGSAGFRVGRALKIGDALGASEGNVIQTGGSVTITGSTQGLRLSAGDSGNVADSYYRISGGSLLATGASNAIQVGNLGSNYVSSEFHVYGSGATEIRTDDFRMQDSPNGTTTLHLSLDAGGVTPITADDEFQFRGTNDNNLLLDLIGLPPMADITLVTADRLGNNSGATELFDNYAADLAPISASFGPPRQQYTYNWLLDYQDAGDNGVLDAYIILRFQSRTLSVPEPASLSLVALGGLAFLLPRRRGC